MTKIRVNFRLEDYTHIRLEKLVEKYSNNNLDQIVPGQKRKLNKTDVIDYLINKAYEEMEIEEEKKWAERNINKLQ